MSGGKEGKIRRWQVEDDGDADRCEVAVLCTESTLISKKRTGRSLAATVTMSFELD